MKKINLKKETRLLLPLVIAIGLSCAAKADDTTDNSNRNVTVNNNNSESHRSDSGLFVEPILFASSENSNIYAGQVAVDTSSNSGSETGYGVGLRLGAHIADIAFLGVDGRYASETLNEAFYSSANATTYNYGPMVGIQTPLVGIRLMATYVVGGEFNPSAGAGGLDLKYTDPRGWRLGAGIHIAAVSVNLEYEDLTYNTTTVESLGSFPVNQPLGVTDETKGYMLSLSFPLAF